MKLIQKKLKRTVIYLEGGRMIPKFGRGTWKLDDDSGRYVHILDNGTVDANTPSVKKVLFETDDRYKEARKLAPDLNKQNTSSTETKTSSATSHNNPNHHIWNGNVKDGTIATVGKMNYGYNPKTGHLFNLGYENGNYFYTGGDGHGLFTASDEDKAKLKLLGYTLNGNTWSYTRPGSTKAKGAASSRPSKYIPEGWTSGQNASAFLKFATDLYGITDDDEFRGTPQMGNANWGPLTKGIYDTEFGYGKLSTIGDAYNAYTTWSKDPDNEGKTIKDWYATVNTKYKPNTTVTTEPTSKPTPDTEPTPITVTRSKYGTDNLSYMNDLFDKGRSGRLAMRKNLNSQLNSVGGFNRDWNLNIKNADNTYSDYNLHDILKDEKSFNTVFGNSGVTYDQVMKDGRFRGGNLAHKGGLYYLQKAMQYADKNNTWQSWNNPNGTGTGGMRGTAATTGTTTTTGSGGTTSNNASFDGGASKGLLYKADWKDPSTYFGNLNFTMPTKSFIPKSTDSTSSEPYGRSNTNGILSNPEDYDKNKFRSQEEALAYTNNQTTFKSGGILVKHYNK